MHSLLKEFQIRFKSNITDESCETKGRTQTYPLKRFAWPREQIDFNKITWHTTKAWKLRPLSTFITTQNPQHTSPTPLLTNSRKNCFKIQDAYICIEPVPLSQANGMTSRKHQRHPKASHPSNWHDQWVPVFQQVFRVKSHAHHLPDIPRNPFLIDQRLK